ncbi:MAG: hypothetical protein AB1635_19015 [Acidobacteriota bacterium]
MRWMVAPLLVLAAALAGQAAAQDQAEVTWGGASVLQARDASGEFEDLAHGHVYLRVSLHDQRRIPLVDIWMITFDRHARLTLDDVKTAAGPEHVLFLRDGRHVKGRLAAIEGGPGSSRPGQPRVVRFVGTGGAEAAYPVRDVARLFLRDPTDGFPYDLKRPPPRDRQ